METKKKVGRPVKTSEVNPGNEEVMADLVNVLMFFRNRTWLTNTNFLKRSFAILGYCVSAYLIVLLGIMIFVALFQAVFE